MKAISLDAPRQLRQVSVAEPPPPGPGQVLARIHRVGICGTDYAGYLGKMPYFSYPRIPGHELGIEVLAVGRDVGQVAVGDRCAVEPYINCQNCYSCRRGHTNCCEQHQTLGVMCDGGLVERMLLPARKLHPSRQLSFEQLALVETLAIGCHAVQRSGAGAGENVLVIGAGPIGLSVIEFVKLSGARTIVVDLSAPRLAFVRDRMGVPDTILLRPGDEAAAVQQLAEWTQGQLADAVIDATGSAESMGAALAYCAFAGRLVYVGITQQEVRFPHAPLMHRRELTIRASRNALAADFTRIIQLIEGGQIDTRPWITHGARLDDLIEAFPGWLSVDSGVIKAVVTV
jgi:2-desacetyl-2-hydroxyethyl bacteriochlorophyllide A dehydrogenase